MLDPIPTIEPCFHRPAEWVTSEKTSARHQVKALRAQDVGELLQEATRLVSEAIEVDLVKVLEPISNGQELLVRAGVNWNPGVVGEATIPAGRGSAAGHALRTNAPVISDVATERRFSTPRLLIEHGVQSTVNVVIRGEKGPFGVLEVIRASGAHLGKTTSIFFKTTRTF